ncbi:hypothetical protein CH304_18475 [Rhodococcus sp. 15-649-1-2]|nr:restriction endonuclease subunit S [Rhodococcus sp. 15-649-1-2]OZE80086.1 hypothetical protein CH304_18475 [Rhodococcus sp. 15-649-1-2]
MNTTQTIPLASITSWSSGGTPSRSNDTYWNGAIPWISAATLKGSRIHDSDQYLTEAGLRAGSNLAPKDAILVLVRGMALHRETRIGLATRPVSFNQDVKALVPKAGILPEFLLYALQARSNLIRELVSSAGSGTGVLNTQLLQRLPIWVPNEQAQHAVVETMSSVDHAITTLEHLSAKKQAVKQGMMQQLLTGRTRLPGFDTAWNEAKLGSIATVIMGQSPAGFTYNSDGRGLPLIQGNADIRDRVTFDRIWTTEPTKTCEEGDVLLTVRAPVGYTAIASKRSCLGRGVCAISTRRDNRFMFHALVYAEPAWALYEQGSTFTAVNSNEVRSFAIRWPTDANERAAIAAALDDVDSVLRTLQARLTKARAIKFGMLQQLLTGRTRLPEETVS